MIEAMLMGGMGMKVKSVQKVTVGFRENPGTINISPVDPERTIVYVERDFDDVASEYRSIHLSSPTTVYERSFGNSSGVQITIIEFSGGVFVQRGRILTNHYGDIEVTLPQAVDTTRCLTTVSSSVDDSLGLYIFSNLTAPDVLTLNTRKYHDYDKDISWQVAEFL